MYCEKPNIILSKTLYRVFSKLGRKCVYTDGVSIYPIIGKLPSPASVGATMDNYKNWSVLTEDGELIPMFFPVPCGKCLLCRDKKAKEWSTRATCESATATYPPVFVTLTYAPWSLPSDGLQKDHLQKFIKRFRENWCRMYGNERLDLRYFACGEYGSKYGRPHYHLLFWNVPNDTKNEGVQMRMIESCVKKSWCEPVTKDEYFAVPLKYIDCRYKFEDRYYRLFGRIEVTADRGSSGAYCMKYMRKPKDVPLQWSQPTFYLSSRRSGGIGMRYLDNIIESIRTQKPAETKLLTPAGEFSLPRSFKDKIFPSLSIIIPVHVRCQLVRFDKIYRLLKTKWIDSDFHMIEAMYDSLRQHYGRAYDYIVQSEHLYHGKDDLIQLPRGYVNFTQCEKLYNKAVVSFVQCYEWQPDTKRIEYFLFLKEKRNEILAKFRFPEIDVSYEVYKVRQRLRDCQRKEVF